MPESAMVVEFKKLMTCLYPNAKAQKLPDEQLVSLARTWAAGWFCALEDRHKKAGVQELALMSELTAPAPSRQLLNSWKWW